MPGRKRKTTTQASTNVNSQAIVPAHAMPLSTTGNLLPFLHQSQLRQIEDSLQRAIEYLYSFAPTLFTCMKEAMVEVRDVISYLKPLLLPHHPEPFSLEFFDKEARDVTDFKDNIVGSVTLPDTVTHYSPKIQSVTNHSYWNQILSFFNKAESAPVASKPAPTKAVALSASPSTPTVRSILEMLQARIETLTDPKEIDKLELQRVELVAEEIKEHAARRVDSFFYLLIAVYRKKVEVKKLSTIKQHGQGSMTAHTDACHNAFFTNVELVPLKNAEVISFAKKHFGDVLGMTMELPKVVNIFDMYLERVQKASLVNYCLQLLNNGACNDLEPRQAMADFFKAMDVFFKRFEKRLKINKKGKIKYPLALLKILEYQKEGTFWAAKQISEKDFSLRDEYFYMMLRTKPRWFGTLRKQYEKIQKEIYTSPPTEPEPHVRRRLGNG